MHLKLIVAIFSLSILSAAAKFDEEDFQKAVDKYIKGYYTLHKDEIDEKSSRKYVESQVQILKDARSFGYTISKSDEATIKKTKVAAPEFSYKAELKKLKDSGSKRSEVTYLINYAEKYATKKRNEEYLVAYRMMKYWNPQIGGDSKDDLRDTLTSIRAHYRRAKEKLGRDPKNIEELELPEEIRYFVDPKTKKKQPWIYCGDKDIEVSGKKTRVIVAAPVKISGESTVAIKSGGEITRPHLSTITKQVPIPEMPSEEELAQAKYLKEIKNEAMVVIKQHEKIMAYLEKNPKFKDKVKNGKVKNIYPRTKDYPRYTSPEGDKQQWVYIGATHVIKSQDKRLICVTSKPALGDNHLGFDSEGNHFEISPKKFKVIWDEGLN